MPCPPSWEELEQMALDRNTAQVLAALRRDLPAVPAVLALAQTLRPMADTVGVEGVELDRTLAEAEAMVAAGLLVPSLPPFVSDSPYHPTEAKIAHQRRELDLREHLARRAALALCILRTFLARCAQADLLTALNPAQRKSLRAALTAHARHRREERRIALLRARSERQTWRRHPNGAGMVANLDARIARLKALDTVTLCTDRQCLR